MRETTHSTHVLWGRAGQADKRKTNTILSFDLFTVELSPGSYGQEGVGTMPNEGWGGGTMPNEGWGGELCLTRVGGELCLTRVGGGGGTMPNEGWGGNYA